MLALFWVAAMIYAARVEAEANVKLFVFGDSYADTGNCRKPGTVSWKNPYGITFPGKPTGRFSNGRVFTDYMASYLGIEPPTPYNEWRDGGKVSQPPRHGLNFAHGGTGVFNTLVSEPNMTMQIDTFQRLVERNVFTKRDLDSSIALVSLAGNDYAARFVKEGSLQDVPSLATSIVNQLALNLKRIGGLGVKKLAVTSIEPMGCLPQLTVYSSYKNCSETWNSVTDLHNRILQQTLQKLKDDKVHVVVLDLHAAFMSALKGQQNRTGSLKLKPCCVGLSSGDWCGRVDGSGAKKYVVCKNPELSFFWDTIHPSQSGWQAVYSALRSSLHRLR